MFVDETTVLVVGMTHEETVNKFKAISIYIVMPRRPTSIILAQNNKERAFHIVQFAEFTEEEPQMLQLWLHTSKSPHLTDTPCALKVYFGKQTN